MGNLFADDDFELCYDGVRFGEILSDLHNFSSDRDKWLVLEGHMLQLSTASSWCTIGVQYEKSEIYVLRKAAGSCRWSVRKMLTLSNEATARHHHQ